MRIQCEALSSTWDDVAALMADEAAPRRWGRLRLDPDRDGYLRADAAGTVRCYTARDDEQVVGYYLLTVAPMARHKHIRNATVDSMYALATHRAEAIPMLIDFAESALRVEGIDRLTVHADTVLAGAAYSSLGYTWERVVRMKVLRWGQS